MALDVDGGVREKGGHGGHLREVSAYLDSAGLRVYKELNSRHHNGEIYQTASYLNNGHLSFEVCNKNSVWGRHLAAGVLLHAA